MEEISARLTIPIATAADIAQQIGPGGLFIPTDNPSPRGAQVAVDFVDGQQVLLSRVICEVVDPAATVQGYSGMTLKVVSLDRVAQAVLKQYTSLSTKDAIESSRQRVDSITGFFASGEGPIVGMDLGTTNSCVGFMQDGNLRILPTLDGYDTLPSIVYLTADNQPVVGHKARDRMLVDPTRAIYGSKRFLGRPFTEQEVRTYGHFFRWELAPDRRGQVAARIGDVVVSLEVVAATLLKQLRLMAEHALGQAVTRAVVTVPAYFGERQRQAVVHAGKLAGLNVERILNEPTAGAVAYGHGKGLKSTVLVYDLGGGTFDASVLRINGDQMEVLATDGGPFLGGSDFDDRLTEYVFASIEKEHHIDLRGEAVVAHRIRMEAEKVKLQLSEADAVQLELPYLVTEGERQISLRMRVERDLLDSLTMDLVDRTMVIVQSVLDEAGITSRQLDDVIMIGGQSRSPLVRRRLEERFGRQPSRHVHPDHAVALGAALVAASGDTRGQVQLTDVLPASIRLGDGKGDTVCLLSRGAPLPVMKTVEATSPTIALYRGESSRAAELEPLGSIALQPSWFNGNERPTVRVLVSAQGLMTVTAEDPHTGQEQELEVHLSGMEGVAQAAADEAFFSL